MILANKSALACVLSVALAASALVAGCGQEEQAQQPTGPALDMKTSSGAVNSGESAPINSLEAAMERLQNEQLERLRK